MLIELCTENNLRILNGRTIGDWSGKKTCFQYNGSSLVDYVIAYQELIKNVQYLKTHHLKPHLSDHCQLSYSMNVNRNFINTNLLEDQDCIEGTHKKLIANEEGKSNIPVLLSNEYAEKLDRLFDENVVKTKRSVNSLVCEFSDTLQELSLKAGFKYSKETNFEPNNNPWFDHECKSEKRNLIQIGKRVCKEPQNKEMRNCLKTRKRKFKKLCKNKKKTYFESKIKEMDFKNPKVTWRQVKKLFSSKDQKSSASKVEIKEFYELYKNQNSKVHQNIDSPQTLDHNVTMDDNQDSYLNSEISTQEISDAIKRLKNGKSPGRDNVLNEILKSGEEYLITPLKRLFNIVFTSNHFPEE